VRFRTIVLSGLLGASLLGNIILLSRSSETPPAPPSNRDSDEAKNLRASLDHANAELAATKADLAQLAAKSQASTPSLPAAAEPQDRVSHFRKRLHSLSAPQNFRTNRDPGDAARESDLQAEFHRLEMDRQQNPAVYGKCMAACLEKILQESKPPMDPQQQAALQKALSDVTGRFEKVADETTPERVASELRLEADLWGTLREILTEEQFREASVHPLSSLLVYTPVGGIIQSGAHTLDYIASVWADSLGVSEEQRASFQGQAQLYMTTIRRLEYEAAPDGLIWDILYEPKGYDFRARAMQAQAEAIKGLTPYLTPDQARKLRTMAIQEYLFSFLDNGK
jgi:hypothetical protein